MKSGEWRVESGVVVSLRDDEKLRGEKKRLRRGWKDRAAKLTDAYRREADRAMREKLLQSELWRSASGVFVYVSVQNEPDTRALIEDALGAGKRVYVPLCCAGHVMKAVRIRSLDELRPGVLGIPEPPADSETAEMGDLDLAVVPCVTATRGGQRLGHGAGYYDRFLQSNPCPTLCLCYEAMLSETVPADRYDAPMDYVLSERACCQRHEEERPVCSMQSF